MLTITVISLLVLASVYFYFTQRRERTRHQDVLDFWRANVELKRTMLKSGKLFDHDSVKLPAEWNHKQRDLYVQLWSDEKGNFELSDKAAAFLKYRRLNRIHNAWLKLRRKTPLIIREALREVSMRKLSKPFRQPHRTFLMAPMTESQKRRCAVRRQQLRKEQARVIREWQKQGWKLTVIGYKESQRHGLKQNGDPKRPQGLVFVRHDRADGVTTYHEVPRVLHEKVQIHFERESVQERAAKRRKKAA